MNMRGTSRTRRLLSMVLVGLIIGCSANDQPKSVSSVVFGWANLGMYLPSERDVAFIRDRLPQSLSALGAGLTNKNEHVRMSSAYTAEKLGPQARPLVPAMIDRLQSEPAFTIRVYLASAVAAIGGADSNEVRRLEDCFVCHSRSGLHRHFGSLG